MVQIVIFLLIFLAAIVATAILPLVRGAPEWYPEVELFVHCALVGGTGGVIYCLRAVYLNACVHKRWDAEWHAWYYIRPFVSTISGGISWLFLQAGLLVLDADNPAQSSTLGFLALAFIAGYNVDKFMNKIEQLSEAAWGIERTRASKERDSE